MKRNIIGIFFLIAVAFVNSHAQDNQVFSTFAKQEKNLMLSAYAKKDVKAYNKHLNEFLTRYNKLNDKEKERYSWDKNEAYYLMADVYALNGDKKKALYYLRKSTDYDYRSLLEDHDLDNLRKDPQFIKLLNESKNQKSDVQLTLQKAPKYNLSEKIDIPAFTYQSADDTNLQALKNTYHLDSIAGKGNDLSRMINLMEWVHYLIPHDGSKGNPATKNAMSLIATCTNDHRTLNCRGLAILLNEVYLAEGFKSKYVTCLPKDTADGDCHVITSVWSTSLKKWIWMDPTFMAYVMDENGTLLSIEEVRSRLINNNPLILNPDANHNHNESQTKKDYLGWYMSKNLYKLESPVNSQYNYETEEEGKTRSYIQLVPGDSKPVAEVNKNKHGLTTSAIYYTNNPQLFWMQPIITPSHPVAKPRTANEYEAIMEQFKTYYNLGETDSIVNMFDNPKEMKAWFTKDLEEKLTQDYGKIISFKYESLTEANTEHDYAVALFKLVCEKSVHMMGISIDRNNKIGTFRFKTSSKYIDKLLAKDM